MLNAIMTKAVAQVEELLLNHWLEQLKLPLNNKRYEVKIEAWRHKSSGLRVAEIGFMHYPSGKGTMPMSGSVHMQSDFGTGEAIFAAERLLLEITLFGEDQELYEERLLKACLGKEQ